MPTVAIPNRSLFRAPEVCQIVGVQSYVLRSWELEFPDLGVSRRDGSPRVYRRSDVERVLRIKHLVFVEGLTLAGARRRLGEEARPAEPDGPPLDELLGRDARERLQQVRDGLREVLQMLSRRPPGAGNGEPAFELRLVGAGVATPAKVASGARRRERSAAGHAARGKKPVRRARR
jgi:DNA-binding transcriptional MerR regulator